MKEASSLIICRCEEVSAAAIDAAVAAGAGSLREVRLCTRAGMGVCGGRTCRPAVAALLRAAGVPAEPPPRWRWPVRPVLLGDLAATEPGDGGETACG